MKRIRLFFTLTVSILMACSSGSNGNGEENTPEVSKIPVEAIHALENDEDLDALLERIGDAPIVLLGEATHGTSEFYTWRARISKKLIEEKDFNIIAVEGDWTDAYPLNNYVKGNSNYSNARQVLKNFDRWPQWMWANEEIEELAEWLRNHNANTSQTEKVGFYGIDVYGIWESLDAIYGFLESHGSSSAPAALEVKACFEPYQKDEHAYARATIGSGANCSDELARLLQEVELLIQEKNISEVSAFNALQNIFVVINAENYFRTAVANYAASWNIRDMHMTCTIDRLLEFYGENAKIIVWEHNTHVGDARATDMANAGMVNVGQLVRENYDPENVYIIGFGTYSGKVLAASSWGNRVQVMNVPNAKRNSWEWLLHNQGPPNKIIFLEHLKDLPFFNKNIGHRAIGVVYDPGAESGNYVPSILPARYDAFIFIDKTTALTPLN